VDTVRLPASVVGAARADGWLVSVWVPVTLGVLALVILVVAVRAVARRRGWRRVVVTGLAAVFALVLFAAGTVNSYAGYLPSVTSVVQFASGTERIALPSVSNGAVVAAAARSGPQSGAVAGRWSEQVLHLSDAALGIGSRSVIVALPPGYATGDYRYPVIYLLNGYPGRPTDWFVGGRATQTMNALVASHLAPPAILVAPDVNGAWFHDSETLNAVGGPQVETWLSQDVVGWVDGHLRSRPDRADRVLAGMSSGGFAALNVGLHHLEQFGVIAAFEPYGDPGNVAARLLGGSSKLLHANSPDWYVPTMVMHWKTAFYLDAGAAGQRDLRRVRGLADLLASRGQQVTFRVQTGRGASHTWKEAAQGFPYAMTFAQQYLGATGLNEPAYPGLFPTGRRNTLATQLSPDGELKLLRQLQHHHVRIPVDTLGRLPAHLSPTPATSGTTQHRRPGPPTTSP
jgi:enterochelin esterase-like enzyme